MTGEADLTVGSEPTAVGTSHVGPLDADYALSAGFVATVIEAADRRDGPRLSELVASLRPADVADLMGFLPGEYRAQLVPVIAPSNLAEILAELDTGIREELLASVASGPLARAIESLETDDAADVVDDLPRARRADVLAALPAQDRTAIEASLAYGEETAGRLMQREVALAPQFWSVGQALDELRAADETLPELFFDVYVVDPAMRPVGAVPVSRLVRAPRQTAIVEVMEPVTAVPVEMDQEEVAYIFDKYHLISAPVVERGGRLVGQITVDDVIGVIQEESGEDMLALANVSDAGRDASTGGIVRSRFPWLVVNLVSETVAVSAIAIFQNEVARIVALAVLLPIISSLGNNASVQTLAVAVRSLASHELNAANAWRVIRREIAAGLINGAALSVLMGAAVVAFYHDWKLALTAALALMADIVIAAIVGILAPMALERLGRDPAVSSPIIVTFTTDFVGFFALLAIASVIMV